MLVKFVGKGSQFVVEFNGKKYLFSKAHPLKDIPQEVYDYVKVCNLINSGDLIPVLNVSGSEDAEKLQAEISSLKAEIEVLKENNAALRMKLEGGQEESKPSRKKKGA